MKTKLTMMLLVFTGGIILFANQIFAADSTNAVGQVNETSPLKIIVTPEKSRVHVKEPFTVSLEVKNVSNTNQSFTVMYCSWYEQWQPDNPAVQMIPWNCMMNYPMKVSLAPGQSFKEKVNNLGEEMKMQVITATTNKISFKMGFTPLVLTPDNQRHRYSRSEKTYWSDAVTVTVNPKLIPDWISW